MWIVIVALLLVASARLTIWTARPRSRTFTLALFTLAVSYVLALPVVDRRVDPVFTDAMGQNISDLAHTVLLVAACWLYGLVFVRVLSEHRYRWLWSAYACVTVAALIVTSRLGDAVRVPVEDEFELNDVASTTYSGLFLVLLAATCVLIFAGTVKAFQVSEVSTQRAYMALSAVGVLGVAYTGVASYWLIADPHVLAEQHGIIVRVAAAPILGGLALAGLYGVADAWLMRWRERADPPP